MTRVTRVSRTGRTGGVLAGVLALAFCATACGIRTTSVPVDAGPAPSRMPCEVPRKDVVTQTTPGLSVRVYLECSSELASVERAARIQDGKDNKNADNRARLAQVLLDELQARPSAAEREAGFTTEVRGPLAVSPGRSADPAGTLRLSRQPEDLPAAALAQIVCTFAESAATDGKVVLGGPGDYPPRAYVCAEETKNRPDSSVPTLGPVTASPSS
ncbi:hypothetical protein ACIO1C_19485 [Streptomyces sp. NPDC087420]|uniref:hypothetical protein n=1 Tax=Streptomyces sp. NPDC087420 TaxID=3365785 RepID=UPI00383978D6